MPPRILFILLAFFLATFAAAPLAAAEEAIVRIGSARAGAGEPITLTIDLLHLPATAQEARVDLTGIPQLLLADPRVTVSGGGMASFSSTGDAMRLSIAPVMTPIATTVTIVLGTADGPILLRTINGEATVDGAPVSVVAGSLAVSLITNPVSIFASFGVIVALVFWLTTQPNWKPFFRYLPAVIWMYFLPMIGTTLGITPDKSTLYNPFMMRVLLPATLVLLLISSDLRGVAKLGPTAIIMMLWATTSIVIGGIGAFAIVHFLFPGWLPEDAWKGVAAMAGSWIGGSANMTAVIGSLDVPPMIIGPIIIMDTVLVYSWLAVLVTLSNYHHEIDRKHGARTEVVTNISRKMEKIHAENERPIRVADAAMMVGLAFAIGHACMLLGPFLYSQFMNVIPKGTREIMSEIMTPFTLSILLITVVGIVLSLTRLRKLEHCGASSLGYVGFYFVLCAFGAQANLQAIAQVPTFFLLGVIWLTIHVIILYIGMRLLRAPLFLAATSSMANLGGPASAPLVAAAFYKSMAPLGLLKAVLGGVLGTPIAIFVVGFITRLISGR